MDLLDMSEANIPRDAILKKIKDLRIPQKNDRKKELKEGKTFNIER